MVIFDYVLDNLNVLRVPGSFINLLENTDFGFVSADCQSGEVRVSSPEPPELVEGGLTPVIC